MESNLKSSQFGNLCSFSLLKQTGFPDNRKETCFCSPAIFADFLCVRAWRTWSVGLDKVGLNLNAESQKHSRILKASIFDYTYESNSFDPKGVNDIYFGYLKF